jgi:uncharacterized protein
MQTYSVSRLRLRPGEVHDEVVAVAVDPFVFGGQSYVPVGGGVLSVALEIQRASSGDVLRSEFEVELAGPCMRCLEDASTRLAISSREYNDASPSAAAELRSDYVADGELALGAWVRDQIALALPDQILCRLDCAGLCPHCGVNLNDEPHEHVEVSSDPRWAALEALRLEADAG